MLPKIDKAELLGDCITQLKSELTILTQSQKGAAQASTHEESKAEDSKDTRATELSYLARGLAKRVAELEHGLLLLETISLQRFSPESPIAVGALVQIEMGDEVRRLFILPVGAGLKCYRMDVEVVVVTPQSPLGKALLGQRVDETVVVSLRGGPRSFHIVDAQ